METRALERTRDDADVSPILASLRCGESSILNAIHEELPEVFTAEILPKLDLISTAQLGAGEQVVQGCGVECGWNAFIGRKGQAIFVSGSRPRSTPISSIPLVVTHGNLPAVRAQLEYFRRLDARGPRCMKMRIKDGRPVEETAIVSEEDKAAADALIQRLENELVTTLNSIYCQTAQSVNSFQQLHSFTPCTAFHYDDVLRTLHSPK
jgi:hypothetical protein